MLSVRIVFVTAAVAIESDREQALDNDRLATYRPLYGDFCPADFLSFNLDPAPRAQLAGVLGHCLEYIFPTSGDMVKSRIFSPASMARVLFETNLLEYKRWRLDQNLELEDNVLRAKYQEVMRLTNAIFDVICLNANLPCLQFMTPGPQSVEWTLLRIATQGIEKACFVIDTFLSKHFPNYITLPEERLHLTQTANFASDSLALHCGGYFVHPQLFRYLIERYRYDHFPRIGGHAANTTESGLTAQVSTASTNDSDTRVLTDALLRLGHAPKYIIDIGAGLMLPEEVGNCDIDPADCLCQWEEFTCLLMEGDASRADELHQRYQFDTHIGNVRIYPEYVTPESIIQIIKREMRWLDNASRGASDNRLPIPFHRNHFPDLLKLDIDNGDCQILEVLLRDGLRPIFIVIEVFQYWLPPNMAYSCYFDSSLTQGMKHQYQVIFTNMLRGCSLGEVLRIVSDEYRVFRLEEVDHDVHLIHRDFLDALPSQLRGTSNLYRIWENKLFPPESIFHEDILMGHPFPIRKVLFGEHHFSHINSTLSSISDRRYRKDFSYIMRYMESYYIIAHFLAKGRNYELLQPGAQEGKWHLKALQEDISRVDGFLENYVV